MVFVNDDERALLTESALFDADWYRNQYADVVLLGMDPATHYLWLGSRIGRDPSPFFKSRAYLAANGDVAIAGMNPLVHYLLHGRAEGRDPCPDVSQNYIADSEAGSAREFEGAPIAVPFAYCPPVRWPSPLILVALAGIPLHLLLPAIDIVRRMPLPFSLRIAVSNSADVEELGRCLQNWGCGALSIDLVEEGDQAAALWWCQIVNISERNDYVLMVDGSIAPHNAILDGLQLLVGDRQPFQNLLALTDGAGMAGCVTLAAVKRPRESMQFAVISELLQSMIEEFEIRDSAEGSAGIAWVQSATLRPLRQAGFGARPNHVPAGLFGALRLSAELAGLSHCAVERHVDGMINLDIASNASLKNSLALGFAPILGSAKHNGGDTGTVAPPSEKERFKATKQRELVEFLATGGRLDIPHVEEPQVSIIVALYNSAELTLPFLRSISDAMAEIPSELILIDNCSSDLTRELLDRVDGAKIILNEENVHFLRAVNQGAILARGEMLALLNNDTIVQANCLALAAENLQDPAVGTVGAKLILPDGTLQEAGSIIWSDGSCRGFGRGANPYHPEFQYRRDVDYCSGAFLVCRRGDFEALGGLDDRYAPAYYEETDFCMRVREAGLRNVYDPRIEVRHFEFGSATSSHQAIALQQRNYKIFRDRHHDQLGRHHRVPNSNAVLAANVGTRPRILFVDDRVPFPEYGAGFPRARDMVLCLCQLGYDVTIFPMTFPEADFDRIRAAYPIDVAVAPEMGRSNLGTYLAARPEYFDAVLVSRPHNMTFVRDAFQSIGSEHPLPPIIYDAEAIFVEREAARRELLGCPFTDSEYSAALRDEIDLTDGASAIVAVSEKERAIFERETGLPSYCVGHQVDIRASQEAFSDRRDFLFLGALTGSSEFSPNVDSLVWFVSEIMPLVDRAIGTDWRLHVVGRVESDEVETLRSDRVIVWGQLDDLATIFEQCRVFLAPTRFAAGIPNKVHEAASRGMPVVATDLIAKQLGFEAGEEILAGSSAVGFANACVRLYGDKALWERIRAAALAKVADDCSPQRFMDELERAVSSVFEDGAVTGDA